MGNNFKSKYIVYETTNIVNNKIYVGVHHTATPYVFDLYLGCGVVSTQPHTYEHAKTAFQFAVKKHGPKNFIRKTLAVFDTLQEAFDLEREIVNEEFIAREDTYNMVLGGGIKGLYETVRKTVYQYDLEGNFVNEFSSFYEAGVAMNKDYTSISFAVKHKSKCNNYLWTFDKVDKLDISEYAIIDSGRKAIYLYKKDGTFYKAIKSSKDTAKELSVHAEVIKEAAENGILIKDSWYLCYKQAATFDVARKEYVLSRKVYQYDAETSEFIAEFNSQQEAEEVYPKSHISKSIRLKSDDGNGFKWALIKRDTFTAVLKPNTKKPVEKRDLEGNLVCIFESATQAVKADGIGVWNVLRKKSQTYKKHTYTYV